MAQLDDETQRLLDQVSRADDPTAERLERIEAGLHARIAAGEVSPIEATPTTSAALKIGLAASGLVAVLAVASVPFVTRNDASTPAPAMHGETSERSHEEVQTQEPIPSVPAAESSDESERVDPIETTPSLETVGEQTRTVSTPRRARARRPNEPSPSSETPTIDETTTVDEPTLAAELRLMRTAMSHMRREAWNEALEAFERHAEEFPQGALAPEREVGRAEALCKAGRTTEARQVVDRFLGAHASSPLRTRARRACP